MLKAVRVPKYDSDRCFIHFIQRVVTELLNVQPDEMITASRNVLSSFQVYKRWQAKQFDASIVAFVRTVWSLLHTRSNAKLCYIVFGGEPLI